MADAGLRCAVGCARCPLGEAGDGGQGQKEGGLKGWSLAAAAAGYFLIPLALAFVGAAVGGGPAGQCLGALAGLGIGMAGAAIVARRRG